MRARVAIFAVGLVLAGFLLSIWPERPRHSEGHPSETGIVTEAAGPESVPPEIRHAGPASQKDASARLVERTFAYALLVHDEEGQPLSGAEVAVFVHDAANQEAAPTLRDAGASPEEVVWRLGRCVRSDATGRVRIELTHTTDAPPDTIVMPRAPIVAARWEGLSAYATASSWDGREARIELRPAELEVEVVDEQGTPLDGVPIAVGSRHVATNPRQLIFTSRSRGVAVVSRHDYDREDELGIAFGWPLPLGEPVILPAGWLPEGPLRLTAPGFGAIRVRVTEGRGEANPRVAGAVRHLPGPPVLRTGLRAFAGAANGLLRQRPARARLHRVAPRPRRDDDDRGYTGRPCRGGRVREAAHRALPDRRFHRQRDADPRRGQAAR